MKNEIKKSTFRVDVKEASGYGAYFKLKTTPGISLMIEAVSREDAKTKAQVWFSKSSLQASLHDGWVLLDVVKSSSAKYKKVINLKD